MSLTVRKQSAETKPGKMSLSVEELNELIAESAAREAEQITEIGNLEEEIISLENRIAELEDVLRAGDARCLKNVLAIVRAVTGSETESDEIDCLRRLMKPRTKWRDDMPIYRLSYNATLEMDVFANTWEDAIRKTEDALNEDCLVKQYDLFEFKALGKNDLASNCEHCCRFMRAIK